MGRPVVHWELMSQDPAGVSLFTDPEGRMNGLWKVAPMLAKKPARKARRKK
jgi:hypothetical protein